MGAPNSKTAALAVQKKKKNKNGPRSKYTIPRPGYGEHPHPGKGALVSEKGLAIDRPASWGMSSSSWGPWNELEGMLGSI